MAVTRIRGMRDLEASEARRLPERISTAQQNASVDDEKLCRLMGWRLTDLVVVKSGDRMPTPAEMRALYGVFGKSSRGTLQTRWRSGESPPLRPADWVILGDQPEITEIDRLLVENLQLRRRVQELENELVRYRQLEATMKAVAARLARRRAARRPI